MRKTLMVKLVFALASAAIVASCSGRTDRVAARTDVSTLPARSCNPALVINPVFLAPNEGVAGAGGPDLPGAGAAAEPGCMVN